MERALIEAVRAKKYLYDFKLKSYKDSAMKLDTWEHIGFELNMSGAECKRTWNKLRNAYVHAMTRRTSTFGSAKKFKKWTHETEMSFLLPYLTQKISTRFGDSVQTNEASAEDEDDNLYDNRVLKVNVEKQPKTYKDKRPAMREEKDEIDLFFDTMAKTVKSFPKLDQVRLKFEIMRLVSATEMKNIENNDSALSFDSPLQMDLNDNIEESSSSRQPDASSEQPCLLASLLTVKEEQSPPVDSTEESSSRMYFSVSPSFKSEPLCSEDDELEDLRSDA